MAAQLAATVYVKDPDTRQTVTLEQGTSPEPRLAALVTNPAAWVDGKLPRLPKATTGQQQGEAGSPSGDGQDDASGAASATSAAADAESAPADDKQAAKRAAARPARGRKATAEGDSGGQ